MKPLDLKANFLTMGNVIDNTFYRGSASIDGKPVVERLLRVKPGGSPDAATRTMIRLAEETLDRRIVGEAHQIPGQAVTITVRKIVILLHGQPQ